MAKVDIYSIRSERNSRFLYLGNKTKFTKLFDKRYVLYDGINTLAFGNYIVRPVYEFLSKFDKISQMVSDESINTAYNIEKHCVLGNDITNQRIFLTKTFSLPILNRKNEDIKDSDFKKIKSQKLITNWFTSVTNDG